MKTRTRDGLALIVSIAALAVGISAWIGGRIEPGLDLVRQPDGSVLVTGVWPGGQAYRNGVKVGMYVQYIGESAYVGLPDTARPPAGLLDPAPYGFYWFGGSPLGELAGNVRVEDREGRLGHAGGQLVWAGCVLAAGLLLRRWPHLVPAGDPRLVRRFALPGAAAIAVPLALATAYFAGTRLGLASLVVLPVLGAWPLIDAAAEATSRRVRPLAGLMLLLAEAAWIGAVTILAGSDIGPVAAGGLILVAQSLAVGGAVLDPSPPIGPAFEARLIAGIRRLDLGLLLGAAAFGFLVLAWTPTSYIADWAVPRNAWLAFVALRLVVVPFIAFALGARTARDSTLDAVEAERVRISSDIHDDVIQELTMLVRRLDAADDRESATIARDAADRLREITGDARLPVLDDLGVAAALDWLVRRMSAVDRGEITLEVDETARPPRPVEVAVYRVAQEAVANALRHGEAPVTVRYRADADRAALEVEDAGPGIPERAEEIADGAGRLGIAGMRRRSATIGATLRIDRRDAGGTLVALDWSAP